VINVSPRTTQPMRRLAGFARNVSPDSTGFSSANSGAEANEGAISSRASGFDERAGAYEIVCSRTHSTGDPCHHAGFGKPSVAGPLRTQGLRLRAGTQERPFGCAPRDRSEHRAVMLDRSQGEAGVVPFTNSFFGCLRELTGELGVLLVLDEIQTGHRRTGRMFH